MNIHALAQLWTAPVTFTVVQLCQPEHAAAEIIVPLLREQSLGPLMVPQSPG
eukprot:COSAG02_NODE_1531_length_12086_cov_22.388588_3_plen_52_part_00